MRGVVVSALLLLSFVVVLPGADAQAEAGKLYLTGTLGAAVPAGGAGPKVFLFSETAPAAGKAYAAFGQGATTYANQFEYTGTVPYTLQGVLTASLRLGCDVAAAFKPGVDPQSATARMIVQKAGVTIGQDDFFANPPITCTSSSTVEMPFSLDLGAQDFAAGEKLAIQFLLWWTQPDEGVTKNGYFHVGPEGSHIMVMGLPSGILPPEPPAVVYGNLTGDSVDLALPFPEPTNATYSYNWTTGLDEVTFRMGGDIVNGSVNVTMLDGAFATVFEGPFAPGQPVTVDATPGNWSITLELDGFQGNLSLEIAAPAPVAPPSPQPDGNGAGNETTGNGTDGGGKGSPGVPLPAILVAVAVAMAVGRRRD